MDHGAQLLLLMELLIYSHGPAQQPISASETAGTTGLHHHTWLIFAISFLFCFVLSQSPTLLSRLECKGTILADYNLHLWGSSESLASPSLVDGITDVHHHTSVSQSASKAEFGGFASRSSSGGCLVGPWLLVSLTLFESMRYSHRARGSIRVSRKI